MNENFRPLKTATLVMLLFLACLVIYPIANYHDSSKQVKEILKDYESKVEELLRKQDFYEISVKEIVEKEEFLNQLKNLSDEYTKRLVYLGRDASDAIAFEGIKYHYLAHGLFLTYAIDMDNEKAKNLIELTETHIIFRYHDEVALTLRSNLCFEALEKLGEASILEKQLTDNVTGAIASYHLAKMGKADILRAHLNKTDAARIEKLNAASGLAVLKDKNALPFLLDNFHKFDYPFDIQLAISIRLFGKDAIPGLLKQWEKGNVAYEFDHGIWSIFWNTGITYQDYIRIEKTLYKEGRRYYTQNDGKYVLFKQDEPPEEDIKKLISNLGRLEIPAIETGHEVTYANFSSLMECLKNNGANEFLILRLNNPGDDNIFHEEPFIRLYDSEGKASITLDTLWIKISKTGQDKYSLNIKTEKFQTKMEFSYSREIFDIIAKARDSFRPTKSYKTLPVLIDPSRDTEMGVIYLILTECLRANVKDVSFAHHTRKGDWAKELEWLYGDDK